MFNFLFTDRLSVGLGVTPAAPPGSRGDSRGVAGEHEWWYYRCPKLISKDG